MITIRIQLFGALRQFSTDSTLSFQLPLTARIADVRVAIIAHARQHWPEAALRLLEVSALASHEAVLRDDQRILDNRELALLPPVSGG